MVVLTSENPARGVGCLGGREKPDTVVSLCTRITVHGAGLADEGTTVKEESQT